ncbi:aberrant root formation protein 4 isoform X1 [Ananas comosus]|uniref:Aberrant root formation protein 4 isoform X1 n=1 Tax=Ananas comosus TaxID=4615 RepID=A0A6P5GDX7_ANACO|nr:aberrant root formation protein 4 isoform X1 [Ananas comosus]
MSTDDPSPIVDLAQINLNAAASSSPLSLRLHDALRACSQAVESGDFSGSDSAVAAVIDLLNSAADPPQSDAESVVPDARVCEELLVEVQRFLSNPPNQMIVDALSLDLPKVVAKYGALSDKCREIAGTIVEFLVSTCSPRDMLSILCEALDVHIRVSKEPTYFILLFHGLAKVFVQIQRHHVEQVKAALPIILQVLRAISSDCHEEASDAINILFEAAIRIGNSMQEMCKRVVEGKKDELRAMLGLYVLQNIALISRSRQKSIVSRCGSLILQFTKFLPFCGFSYFGLITGSSLASATAVISKGDGDGTIDCFSLTMDGAALAVVWGHISDDIAETAGEQLKSVLREIQNNQTARWQAIGTLKYALSSNDYPWELKSNTIDLLLSIMDGCNTEGSDDNYLDFSGFVPSLFVTLQAIEMIMMGSFDASLRKKAFTALRRVISEIPSSHRFDILKALIKNSVSPSLTAILIDLVRAEILTEKNQKYVRNVKDAQFESGSHYSSWSSQALELVELILKPPEGGPPALPDHSEQVLSALNLLRFILIRESTGQTNQKTVLSDKVLQKAYSEWLLPLRALVTGIEAENEKDNSELANDIFCALNPVQLVLYRCIELVEDRLKHS